MDIVQIFDMKTEEIILKRALEMFNEKGIEYVGLREIATDLKMRVSNINYYFPTKDDLVDRLSRNLSLLNSQTIFPKDHLDITSFFEMMDQVFRNQIQYRCLLLSFVHLMTQNPRIAERYKETSTNRNSALTGNLQSLIHNGDLSIESEVEIAYLVSALALIIRFWISEATISLSQLSLDQQIKHYLHIIARLLLPYCSEQGKVSLEAFLAL